MYKSVLILLGISVPVVAYTLYDLDCEMSENKCNGFGIVKGFVMIAVLLAFVVILILVLIRLSNQPATAEDTEDTYTTEDTDTTNTTKDTTTSDTSSTTTTQKQSFPRVGDLVYTDGKNAPVTLPLYGKVLPNGSRWQYYCVYNNVQFKVKYANTYTNSGDKSVRDCSLDFGCYQIQNGDKVIVPDYNNFTFTASIKST